MLWQEESWGAVGQELEKYRRSFIKINRTTTRENYMSGCEAKTGTCEVPQNANVPSGEKCTEGKECCIENKMKMLMCAACEAKKQVMIDILKVKIQKAWGKKMETIADAVMEALESKKEAMVLKEKAKEVLKEKLEGLFSGK